MQINTEVTPLSSKSIWAGRVASALVVLFLLMDGVTKFVKPTPVLAAFAHLGLPIWLATGLGMLLLACTLLYVIPRTASLGAVLLTGYLGGAVSIHLRVNDPLLSHVLFPVYLGVVMWFGLWLRNVRVRELISFKPT